MKTINKKLLLTLIAGLTAASVSADKVKRQELVDKALALGLTQEKANKYNMPTLKRFITRTQNQQATGPTHVAPTTGFNKLKDADIANIHEWLPVKDSAAFMATRGNVYVAGAMETSISRPHAITAIINKYPTAKVAGDQQETLNNALLEALKAGNDDDADVIAQHGGNVLNVELDLSNSNITDHGLEHIATLSSLEELNLTSCANITNQGLRNIASLTNLKVLNLEGCTQITDQGIQYLALLTNLEDLVLKDCTNITDQGLWPLAVSFTRLLSLDLSGCTLVTDEVVNGFKSRNSFWLIVNQ